jgi:glycosyltransferase involved in cell wall biosynthesis
MLGARQHYSATKVLHRAGMLGRLYTDVYVNPLAPLMRLLAMIPSRLRPSWMERLLGRTDHEVPGDKVVSFGVFGLGYSWQARRARDSQALSRVYLGAARAFTRRVIRQGLDGADVVYGCDGASLELFEHAKGRGIPCVLEQTIAPQAIASALLKEEAERWPGWEPGLQIGAGGDGFTERQEAEWGLADLIAGASAFVIESLRQCRVPASKCRLVPYGIPIERFASVRQGRTRGTGKLRVLFVGGVGLRKGVPYLLEALRALDSTQFEVRLAGPVALNPVRLEPYRAMATLLGPVPRRRIGELYAWADVFVLPSICEGSAVATYEALASGLPVIATPNTGAWMRDGIEGTVVPVRDVPALAGAIDRFRRDRDFLGFCSGNVMEGRERLGLDAYQGRVTRLIMEAWGGRISPGVDAC